MAKNGKARVLSEQDFASLMTEIQHHRHPEKNTLIFQISFKLGLRVQEMSLLRIKEVAELDSAEPKGYRVKDILVLPARFTKGARAIKRTQKTYERKSVRFSIDEFSKVINQVIKLAQSGQDINPEDFYPEIKEKGGKTRELPIEDPYLVKAIEDYLDLRLTRNSRLKPTNPLLLSQKGGAYSPNTLQDHMSMMLRQWVGIDRASSHSGRRTLATRLLHDQQEPLKTVQQVLGHKEASTTVIYHEVPEQEMREVLKKVGRAYKE